MGVRALLPSRRIVNMFGAIGYSLLLVAYALVAGVVMLWLLRNGQLGGMDPVPTTGALVPEVSKDIPGSISGLVLELVAYVITAIMFVTVVFVVVTLPYWLGRSGSYVLKRLIRLCQWSVTTTSLLLGKIIACGIVTVPLSMLVIQDMSTIVMLISIGILVCFSLIVFLLQHYLAKMNELEAKEVW